MRWLLLLPFALLAMQVTARPGAYNRMWLRGCHEGVIYYKAERVQTPKGPLMKQLALDFRQPCPGEETERYRERYPQCKHGIGFKTPPPNRMPVCLTPDRHEDKTIKLTYDDALAFWKWARQHRISQGEYATRHQ